MDYSGKFLYVVNQDDNNNSGYAVDYNTSTLTALFSGTFATGKAPSSFVTGMLKSIK